MFFLCHLFLLHFFLNPRIHKIMGTCTEDSIPKYQHYVKRNNFASSHSLIIVDFTILQSQLTRIVGHIDQILKTGRAKGQIVLILFWENLLWLKTGFMLNCVIRSLTMELQEILNWQNYKSIHHLELSYFHLFHAISNTKMGCNFFSVKLCNQKSWPWTKIVIDWRKYKSIYHLNNV